MAIGTAENSVLTLAPLEPSARPGAVELDLWTSRKGQEGSSGPKTAAGQDLTSSLWEGASTGPCGGTELYTEQGSAASRSIGTDNRHEPKVEAGGGRGPAQK